MSQAQILATSGTASPFAFRNRVINGAMKFYQINSGAAFALNNSAGYVIDKWALACAGGAGTGAASVQRVADAPAGFTYSLKYTVTTAKAVSAATDSMYIYHPMEGQYFADLLYGTPKAKSVTLSFWTKSSVTGTYSGFVRQSVTTPNSNRTFVFSYTINTANTWEFKTITVPGDPAGAFDLTTTGSFSFLFDLGSGSNVVTPTPGVWTSGNYYRSATSVNLIATANATFQITGVQFEVGTVATPFERRLDTTEFTLCQRYYQVVNWGVHGIHNTTANGYLIGRLATPMVGGMALATANGLSLFGEGGNFTANGTLQDSNGFEFLILINSYSVAKTAGLPFFLSDTNTVPLRFSTQL
jgi:hypothetical protein